jgi:hypothetical protein
VVDKVTIPTQFKGGCAISFFLKFINIKTYLGTISLLPHELIHCYGFPNCFPDSAKKRLNAYFYTKIVDPDRYDSKFHIRLDQVNPITD